ncbi:ribose-phosphate pyrophosphokinase [Candidatus Dojkabacteria bacterium]|nr:ribose-phosphate pyrophosphokinase [Candidatus Dojkabacteria bacterium]
MKNAMIISGSSNNSLAKSISKYSKIPIGKTKVENFPNKEIRILIKEDLKEKNVFLVQATNGRVNSYIIELALLADAAKRCGAKKIIAIIPWLGYSPQDKVFRKGEPLSSKVIVKMLESTQIDKFILIDVHSKLVLKMFTKPVVHLSAMPVFVEHFKGKLEKTSWVSVALDKGARERAKLFSKELGLPLVQFDKERDLKTGEVKFKKLEGNVKGKNVISFDDFVSTGGTRIQASKLLKQQGAKKYIDCVTHLIVPETTRKFPASKIDEIYITNTIHLDTKFKTKKLHVLDIGKLIARGI